MVRGFIGGMMNQSWSCIPTGCYMEGYTGRAHYSAGVFVERIQTSAKQVLIEVHAVKHE